MPQIVAPLLSSHRVIGQPDDVDLHLFTTGALQTDGDGQMHPQRGKSFAERIENAVETLAALGYSEVVMIGRDCPELSEDDICVAFRQLASKRLVLGPDHRGGCYLIAFRCVDRHLLRGITWQRDIDCAQLRARCAAAEVAFLAVKRDLDSIADLRLIARGDAWFARIARSILCSFVESLRWPDRFVDRLARLLRIQGQLPPPAFAA